MKKQLGAVLTALIMIQYAAHAAPPANDAFTSATTITGPTGTPSGNNSEATIEVGEPDASRSHSVWFN